MQTNDMSILAVCQTLRERAALAERDLTLPARAADALYALRLCLRIGRILRHFVRKDPAYRQFSADLDQCYRATSRLRDLEVGIGLIVQLEQGWPRNRRRPSTALKQDLARQYRAFAGSVATQGLAQGWQGLADAVARLEARKPARVLQRRARHHARRLARILATALARARKRQRPADWHALRLAIKHYRFWVTSLPDWLPRKLQRRAQRLKAVQVALGDYHDWDVLAGWLPDLPDAPLTTWLPDLQRRQRLAWRQAQDLVERL